MDCDISNVSYFKSNNRVKSVTYIPGKPKPDTNQRIRRLCIDEDNLVKTRKINEMINEINKERESKGIEKLTKKEEHSKRLEISKNQKHCWLYECIAGALSVILIGYLHVITRALSNIILFPISQIYCIYQNDQILKSFISLFMQYQSLILCANAFCKRMENSNVSRKTPLSIPNTKPI